MADAILAKVQPLLAQVPPLVLALLASLGGIQIAKVALGTLDAFYRFFLRGGVNVKKYGEWAVVTGATGG